MRRALLVATVLGLSLLGVACKEDADPTAAIMASPGVAKCKTGLGRAVKAPTANEATAIYDTECSALFSSQPACRDAWLGAATRPESEQIPAIAEPCRKAYCPTLTAFAFEACRDDFKATPEALTRAWPPLFDAILTREAAAAAPDISGSMLMLYAHLKQLQAASAAEAPSGVPSAKASAAAVPAASAVPALAGSSHGGALKASPTKAKP